jgi:hypothetical protein
MIHIHALYISIQLSFKFIIEFVKPNMGSINLIGDIYV